MSPADDSSVLPTSPPYPSANFAKVVTAVRELQHPTQIGPYHLLGLVGEGGMGTVYKAEQRQPIHRIVALKVIKLGMDTRQVIARFESERQALAVMNHVNVARVLDAGATETGRPYFVMEFVGGEPITAFADRRKLTIRERLELFAQACAAVQHAHQKAIIHRDLKPTNILVMLQDDKPLVKVIDFGVAKATAHRLTEHTLFTETGQLVGTPEYMAPEQAEASAVDVDTRTDVYSLGVVLYELLSGALPFEAKSLRSAGYHEIQRIIRDVDPPRPSSRLLTGNLAAETVATQRRTTLDALQRQLRSELEWIPLKAMRKDRTHRYASAAELAEDMANYLENKPLRAGPESTGYRLRKFLRRNRTAVTAAAGITIALIAGGIISTALAIQLKRQKDQVQAANDNATAVIRFLTDDVLGSASPFVSQGNDTSVKEAVDAAAAQVDQRFKDQPLVDAAVRVALASVYRDLGQAELALPHAERAFKLREKLLEPDSFERLHARHLYGEVLGAAGKFEQAEEILRAVVEDVSSLGPDDPRYIDAQHAYAGALSYLGRLDEAEQLYRKTYEARRRVSGEDHRDTIMELHDYAAAMTLQGRFAEAEPLFRKAREQFRRLNGDDHPNSIGSAQTLAYTLSQLARLGEAETLYREALGASRRVNGVDHPMSITLLQQLGTVVGESGKAEEGLQIAREVYEHCRRVHGPDHPETNVALSSVAAALVVLDRTAESEPIYKEALNQSRRAFGDEHPNTITACNNYAFCLLRLDRLAEAEPYFVEVYERGMRSLPKAHPARGMILNGYAELLVKLNRQQQAAPLQEQYVAFCRQVHGADHSSTKHAEKRLASIRDALAGHEVPTAASTAPTTTPERRP